MVVDADGQYLKAKIETDVQQEQQQLLAKGIQEMNSALAPDRAARQL